MQPQTVVVIYNGKAGSSDPQVVADVCALARKAGYIVSSTPTTPEPNSARYLASKAADASATYVVAIGGDGTARQVAEGLVGSDSIMLIYHGGTGNLFANSFYSRPTPERFMQMLTTGVPQSVDLIRFQCTDIEGHKQEGYIMVGVGFGFLADAISEGDPVWKKRFGTAVYGWNMMKKAPVPEVINASLYLPSVTKQEQFSTGFILNVPPHMMPKISRGCNASDGLMDFVGLTAGNFGQVVRSSKHVLMGTPEQSKFFRRYRVPSLVMETDRPIFLNLDGDAGPKTTCVELTTVPGAVRMILA